MQFSSIRPIDRTLSGATIPGQSGPGSNGDEGVLHIAQSISITWTSLLDRLVSYIGHGGGGAYSSAVLQSVHSTADWTILNWEEYFHLKPMSMWFCWYCRKGPDFADTLLQNSLHKSKISLYIYIYIYIYNDTSMVCLLLHCVLHLTTIIRQKISSIFILIMWQKMFGLVWFYSISTIVGYLILYIHILNIWLVNAFCTYTQLNDKPVLFLTIQFSISQQS